jgi:hypothetical protein
LTKIRFINVQFYGDSIYDKRPNQTSLTILDPAKRNFGACFMTMLPPLSSSTSVVSDNTSMASSSSKHRRRHSLGSKLKNRVLQRRPSFGATSASTNPDHKSSVEHMMNSSASVHSKEGSSSPSTKMVRRNSFGKKMKNLVQRRPSLGSETGSVGASSVTSKDKSAASTSRAGSTAVESKKPTTTTAKKPLSSSKRRKSSLDTRSVYSAKNTKSKVLPTDSTSPLQHKMNIDIKVPIQEDGYDECHQENDVPTMVEAYELTRVPSEMTLTVADMTTTNEAPLSSKKDMMEEPKIKSNKLSSSSHYQQSTGIWSDNMVIKKSNTCNSRLPTISDDSLSTCSTSTTSKQQLSKDEHYWLKKYKQQEIEYAALYLHSEHLVKELQETSKLLESESDAARELEQEFIDMELDLSETRMMRDRLERENGSLRKLLARRDAEYAKLERELHEMKLTMTLNQLDIVQQESAGSNHQESNPTVTPRRSTMSHRPSSDQVGQTLSVEMQQTGTAAMRRMSLQATENGAKYLSSGNLRDSLLESLRLHESGSQGQGTFLPPLHPRRRPSMAM